MNVLNYYTNGETEWMELGSEDLIYLYKTTEGSPLFRRYAATNVFSEVRNQELLNQFEKELETHRDSLRLQKIFAPLNEDVMDQYNRWLNFYDSFIKLASTLREAFKGLTQEEVFEPPSRQTWNTHQHQNISSHIKNTNSRIKNQTHYRK